MNSFSFAANIAYIGDSQSSVDFGLFAKLRPALESGGSKVNGARAVCGAKIEDFIGAGRISICDHVGIMALRIGDGGKGFEPGKGKTADIAGIMKDSDTVVIELGDNHLEDGEAGNRAAKLARLILESGKNCVWIGPASVKADACALNLSRKKKTSEAIKTSLGELTVKGRKCAFIDSFALTLADPPPSEDCLHYGDYGIWAKAIEPALKKALAATGPAAK